MFRKILMAFTAVAVLAFPLAIFATRMDWIHFRTGFGWIQYGVIIAVIIFLLGTVVGFAKAKSSPELARVARTCSMLCLLPILMLGNQFYQVQSLPAIHNISTDTENPPAFSAIVPLREEGANPLAYTAEIAEQQLAAYPQVKPYRSATPSNELFDTVVEVVREMGWDLVAADKQSGLVEATDTTLLWGFKDDVVIRLQGVDTPQGPTTQVDLRSVSRVGGSDIGANAKRITGFLDALGEREGASN